MVIERVAKGGARVAGSGIGAALSSPFGLGLLGVAALAAGLFIFRDRISGFFQNIFKIPPIEVDLPDVVIDVPPLPDLPPLPDVPPNILCTLFGIGCEAEGSPPPAPPPDFFDDTGLAGIDLTPSGDPAVIFQDAIIFAEDFPEPFVEPPPPPPVVAPPPPPIVVDPALDIPPDVEFMGGGVSFIGGSIGQNPVDTLFEVLGLFPKLSASGAANFLFLHSGISPSDALMLDDFKRFQ